jgi:hypothetical protein
MMYVTDGTRSIMHDTAFQDFLLKLGYRNVYCPMKAAFSPMLNMVLRSGVHRWIAKTGLARFLPGAFSRMEALDLVMRISSGSQE